MEEAGTQVASPIFIHQPLAGRFCESRPIMAKKRGLPIHPTSFQQHHHIPNSHGWSPSVWNWDSARFVAKPVETELFSQSSSAALPQTRTDQLTTAANPRNSSNNRADDVDENLRLKLGGGAGGGSSSSSSGCAEEPVSRPNKRVRSGSPGNTNYPKCQVDNCKEDLSNAKDYHRRHKVCEVHSKASKALVGDQMQRFCQQCSRFHPLLEFDEGKRSCRRRLAGHNRRRRKTQGEDTTSRSPLPGNSDNSGNNDLDIVNLLAVLARRQGHPDERSIDVSSVPDKDQLMQILTKINSFPLPNLTAKFPVPENLNMATPDVPSKDPRLIRNTSSPSTMDLLAALSGTPVAPTPEALDIQSQRSSHGSDSGKTKSTCIDHATSLNLQKEPVLMFPSVGGESSTSYQSPVEDSDSHGQENLLPLQLFSSSPENDSPPELSASRRYFSSGSSNPCEDGSPSSSPPIMQKLFPLQTTRESVKPESMSTSTDANANGRETQRSGCMTSLQLFGGSTGGADNGSIQSSPYRAGYTSSSASDHSPASLNSDAQDRTGRIIFKLFDKDPSHLPGTLRTQILNWLSNSPSEMESYIRPGCVVLSVYASMSPSAWEQLERNLFQYIKSLVKDFDSDFWRSGRFLVHTEKQFASHKDGRIRICKSWKPWNSPELIAVSPLAVVSGEETSLLLRGRNLAIPGIKINCTHTDAFTIKEFQRQACQETAYDEISLGSFTISGATPGVLGRCFVEVGNGFATTSFPVIIANDSICQELKLLESEISEGANVRSNVSRDHVQDSGRPRSREEVLCFLNEIGWLFQRKGNSSMLESPYYKLGRLRFLFIFAVERDFCALVKTLLDILLEMNLVREGLAEESLEMLSEIHLLNRAVKRRCRSMVDLLVHYSILDSNGTSNKYIFPPNFAGPGGVTPLHLAASTSGSDEIIEALTNDPQEIGLHCWNSLLDANGLTPHAYALMRNNHSYNSLVAQKIGNQKNGQVSVSIGDEIEQLWLEVDQDRVMSQLKSGQKSCPKCSIVAERYNRKIPGSQGLLHQPYIHSMLAIAAVCVCVCLLLRGAPYIGLVAPFKWENLGYGPM